MQILNKKVLVNSGEKIVATFVALDAWVTLSVNVRLHERSIKLGLHIVSLDTLKPRFSNFSHYLISTLLNPTPHFVSTLQLIMNALHKSCPN